MSLEASKITLNEKEELRVKICQWRNRPFADLRVWSAPKPDEPKWPTGKGFLVPLSRVSELLGLIDHLNMESKRSNERE